MLHMVDLGLGKVFVSFCIIVDVKFLRICSEASVTTISFP